MVGAGDTRGGVVQRGQGSQEGSGVEEPGRVQGRVKGTGGRVGGVGEGVVKRLKKVQYWE